MSHNHRWALRRIVGLFSKKIILFSKCFRAELKVDDSGLIDYFEWLSTFPKIQLDL